MDGWDELDRFADDGGRALPDPEVEEERRASLERLRAWLVKVFTDESNFRLAGEIATEALTAARYAHDKGRNRSSTLREFRRLFPRYCKKILRNPDLLSSMPSPWREMYLGE